MCMTPLTVMSCPTRRQAVVYHGIGMSFVNPPGGSCPNIVKGDYAGNGGDSVYASSYRACDPGPTTLAEGDAAFAGARFQNGQSWGANYNVRGKNITTLLPPAWGPTPYNGIIFQNSEVTMGMITDGSSNTYLIGEKYCVQAFYATGNDTSDCETIYNGDDDDNERTAWCSPMQDTPDYYSESWGTPTTPSTISLYGSAHASGLNFAFCDGSVHQISYSINSNVPHNWAGWQAGDSPSPGSGIHQRLANRCDGLTIDTSVF